MRALQPRPRVVRVALADEAARRPARRRERLRHDARRRERGHGDVDRPEPRVDPRARIPQQLSREVERARATPPPKRSVVKFAFARCFAAMAPAPAESSRVAIAVGFGVAKSISYRPAPAFTETRDSGRPPRSNAFSPAPVWISSANGRERAKARSSRGSAIPVKAAGSKLWERTVVGPPRAWSGSAPVGSSY